MAFGLPVEGDDGPFVGEKVTEGPTLDHDDTVAHARDRLAESEAGEAVVLGYDRLAIGLVDDEVLDGANDGDRLLDVMEVVPSTIRPSVTLEAVAEGDTRRVLVTTHDGRLLGVADVGGGDDSHHDHGGHDHDELARMEDELDELMAAVREKFGDREPSEEELRSLLRDRMVAEGRPPDEADRYLADLTGD